MKIKGIRLQGFRGALSPLEIPLGRGFTVICGQNGSGKSSICDAIEYVLTGTIDRFADDTERRESIRDYIWWRGLPEPEARSVAVDFIDSKGKPFTLTRADGDRTDVELASKLYETALAPTDPLSQLALTGIIRDETITKFSVDASERERYDFVVRALGLASSAAVETKTSAVAKHLKERLENYERSYQVQRERVSELITQLSQARLAASRALGRNLDTILSEYADTANQSGTDLPSIIRTIATKLSKQRERIEALTSLLHAKQELDIQIDLAQSQQHLSLTASLASKITMLESQFTVVQGAHERALGLLTQLQSGSPEVSSLALLREHGSRVGLRDQRCPLCGSRISPKDFDRHLHKVDAEVKKSSDALTSATQAEATSRLERERVAGDLELARREYHAASRLTEDLTSRAKEIEQIANNLGVKSTRQDVLAAIEVGQNEVSRLNEHLAIVEAFSSVQVVEDLERKLNEAQGASGLLEKDLQRLSTAEHMAMEASQSAKRVSAEILDERLAALRPLFSELYERLRPHSEWSEADFRMRGDVRRFLSLEVGDSLNPRFMFSSGQRRALGLAFLLSVHLARRWCKLDTIILDDPVQHVDDFRALHLVEALASLRMSDRQIICTVEDPALASLLCRRLRSHPGSEGVRVNVGYVPGTGILVQGVQAIDPLPSRVLVTA